MADLSRKTASVYINHQSAEDALVALQKQADKFNTKIREGQAAGKNMVAEIAKLNKVTNDIKAVQNQIDKGLRPSFNQLSTTVSRLRNELKRMSEDAPGYAAKFKAFNAASTELQRMQTAITGVQKQGSLLKDLFAQALPLIGLAAITGFLKSATTEALEAERANARLKSTLDNLGNTDTFERLSNAADAMAARFKFIDNDDVVGVFEQLITYGKLTEKQITDLTPVIVDFAAKARISLADATSTIIKALEGNGKALKEYGINIKDAGNETERLNLVMTTLKDKVDGAADAFGQTTQGNIATTQQTFKNLKEEVGKGLIPVLNSLLSVINKILFAANKAVGGLKLLFGGEARAVGSSNSTELFRQRQGNSDVFDTQAASFANEVRKRKKTVEELTQALNKQSATVENLKNQYNDLVENASFFTGVKGKDALFNKLSFLQTEINAAEIQKAGISLVLGENTADKTLGINADELDKKIKRTETKFKKLKAEVDKLARIDLGSAKKAGPEDATALPELNPNAAAAGFSAATQKRLEELAASLEAAKGKSRLAIQLKILDTQRLKELLNTEITEQQKDEIIKKYQQKRQQAIIAYYTGQAQKIISVAGELSGLIDGSNAIKNARDENRINQVNAVADAELKANKNLLDKKIITQEEYDRRQKKIEEKNRKEVARLKRAEFDRNKKAEIINATISGAQAILSALQTKPFLLGLFLAGVAAVKTKQQIQAIKETQAPQFARGGVLDGPSHSHGGMPVINPSTGRKVAEMEGGEAILSKRTYANNRQLINALLHSSMYGGGQSIGPAYMGRGYSGVNFPAINNALTSTRKYERGGIFTGDGSTTGVDITGVLQQLKEQLQQPIKTYVSYSDVNAAAELDAKIKSETGFKRS